MILKKERDFIVCDGYVDANWLIGRVNPALDSFLQSAGAPRKVPEMFSGEPLSFCGQRSCAAGERLVVASCYGKLFYLDPSNKYEGFSFSVDVFAPATQDRPLTRVWSVERLQIGHYEVDRQPKDVIRMFAGQSDPQDPTHFTIRYLLNGTEGFIDGNLQADGKTVVVAARGGGPLIQKQ